MSDNSEAAIAAAKVYDEVTAQLAYSCEVCTNTFDEPTVEGVLKRAASNAHGDAITPGLEPVYLLGRMREDAHALLVYQCESCTGEFDEATVDAVLKRAAANPHGDAITADLEKALV